MLYLYKYLYKGATKVKFRLKNADDVNDSDEITLYLRGRYLCSMDAMWRTLGFNTYPASDPPVITIKVKLEEVTNFILREGNTCDLLNYFNRPINLHSLKYTEFFQQYVISRKLAKKYVNSPQLEGTDYYVITIARLNYPLYVTKRTVSVKVIVRMEMVYLTHGEIWYLRLMLLHFSPKNYIDAKTVNGIQYTSFQLAATAAGLVTDLTEAKECFVQMYLNSTPTELRGLFASMTLQGFPTTCIYFDEELRNTMLSDYLYNGCSLPQANNYLLIDLQNRLLNDNSSLEIYGLPSPAANIAKMNSYSY